MKIGLMFLLLLSVTVTIFAQASISEAPDLAVVRYSWSKERINWEGNPFSGPVESFEDVRRRRVDERRLERAKGSGNIGEAAKVEREMRAEQVINARPPAPPRYGFIYKVTVKNTGTKAIKVVDWDYVFVNGTSEDPPTRLEFTSEENIGIGKTKDLTVMTVQPPAKTVSVYALQKNERQGLDGYAVVIRIAFADGTEWKRQ